MKYIKPISFEETRCRTGSKRYRGIGRGRAEWRNSVKIKITNFRSFKISIIIAKSQDCASFDMPIRSIRTLFQEGVLNPLPPPSPVRQFSRATMERTYVQFIWTRDDGWPRCTDITFALRNALCNPREQQTLWLSKVRRERSLTRFITHTNMYLSIPREGNYCSR